MSAAAVADDHRTMAVLCPDWPLVAADLDKVPAAVLDAQRIVATSPSARVAGVRRGHTKREAQRACPGVEVIEPDSGRDAREFEPVIATLAEHVARFEIIEPGLCVFAARGPARYFGGEATLSGRLRTSISEVHGEIRPISCRVGVADGVFAARHAAAHGKHGVVVPPGETPVFLAPFPVDVLDRPGLCDLLRRLGLQTLGEFAALPSEDVASRFGTDGMIAHHLAAGSDPDRAAAEDPPPELACSIEIDPPADQVETVAFSARALVSELGSRLGELGQICTSLAIAAESEHGEERVRIWRHDDGLTEAAVVDRVRWQLEGWIGGRGRPSAGISMLRFVPEQVRNDIGRQLGLWGESSAQDARAARGLARVQGLLGPEAVHTAVPEAGRSPKNWVRLVPWSGEKASAPPDPGDPREHPAWPGQIPRPAPAVVHDPPRPAIVISLTGDPVRIGAGGGLSAEPAEMSIDGRVFRAVASWSAPWSLDERWWDSQRSDRRTRLQVTTSDGHAHLLSCSPAGTWTLDATYD